MPDTTYPAVKLVKAVVTPDDFKNMFAKDLRNILKGSDNDSNYAETFLSMVQEFLMDWCDVNGFRIIKYDQLSPMQLEAFQKAILYQTYYAWRNGAAALGLDSGYDADKGIVITYEDLKKIGVPQRVMILLKRSGLLNFKIRNRPRITRGFPGIIGSATGEDY